MGLHCAFVHEGKCLVAVQGKLNLINFALLLLRPTLESLYFSQLTVKAMSSGAAFTAYVMAHHIKDGKQVTSLLLGDIAPLLEHKLHAK